MVGDTNTPASSCSWSSTEKGSRGRRSPVGQEKEAAAFLLRPAPPGRGPAAVVVVTESLEARTRRCWRKSPVEAAGWRTFVPGVLPEPPRGVIGGGGGFAGVIVVVGV